MTYPLTYKTWTSGYNTSFNHNKWWYAQKAPFNLRLPCRLFHSYAVVGDASSWSWDESSCIFAASTNKARERLVAGLGDTAQLGASIAAEWRSTADMIGTRAKQLLSFTNALRRGRLFEAGRILGLGHSQVTSIRRTAKRKRFISYEERFVLEKDERTIIKNFGSLWLEFSYGWAPIVSDIYTSSQIIEKPPKDITIKGRATHQETYTRHTGSGVWYDYLCVDKCQMIADVVVTNHNTHLANQLGLTNPATWLLEGIPFSFVLDWFSSLSQWVSQLTDFVGLNLSNTATTHLCKGTERLGYTYWGVEYPPFSDKYFVVLKRESGIPPVTLQFGYEIPNWKRGLNAISLLTQALHR